MTKGLLFYFLILLFLSFIFYFSLAVPAVGEYRNKAVSFVVFISEIAENLFKQGISFIKDIIIKQIRNVFSKILSQVEQYLKNKLDSLRDKVYNMSEYNYSYTRYYDRT